LICINPFPCLSPSIQFEKYRWRKPHAEYIGGKDTRFLWHTERVVLPPSASQDFVFAIKNKGNSKTQTLKTGTYTSVCVIEIATSALPHDSVSSATTPGLNTAATVSITIKEEETEAHLQTLNPKHPKPVNGLLLLLVLSAWMSHHHAH